MWVRNQYDRHHKENPKKIHRQVNLCVNVYSCVYVCESSWRERRKRVNLTGNVYVFARDVLGGKFLGSVFFLVAYEPKNADFFLLSRSYCAASAISSVSFEMYRNVLITIYCIDCQ